LKKTWLFLALALMSVRSFAQTEADFGNFPQTEEGIAARSADAGLSAAHRVLPLGARVRVFNPQNNRSVVVTIDAILDESVNRLIDLSPAASDEIAIGESAWVRVDLISLAEPSETAAEGDFDDDEYYFDDDDGEYYAEGDEEQGQDQAITLVPAESRAPAIMEDGSSSFRMRTGTIYQYVIDGSADQDDGGGPLRKTLPESVEQVVITINRQNGGDWEISIDSTESSSSRRSREASTGSGSGESGGQAGSVPEGAFPPNPAQAIRAAQSPARVIPRLPQAGSGKRYLVQAGSFLNQAGAERTLAQVQAAGYRGSLERRDRYIRVVIPGISSDDIPELARRLGREGIREIWLRE
jgi:cell division septation protein DedD